MLVHLLRALLVFYGFFEGSLVVGLLGIGVFVVDLLRNMLPRHEITGRRHASC